MRRRLAASAVPSLAAGLVLLTGGTAAAQPPRSGEAVTGVAATEGGRPTWTEFWWQSDPSGLGGLQSTTGLSSVFSPSWLDSLLAGLRKPLVTNAGQMGGGGAQADTPTSWWQPGRYGPTLEPRPVTTFSLPALPAWTPPTMDRYTLPTDMGQLSFQETPRGFEFQTPTGTRIVPRTDPNYDPVYRATRGLPEGGIPQNLLDALVPGARLIAQSPAP
ncbi:MAG TPA: hypothetical protein VKP11_10670 [Frankiaceae bacterium]|nr:hypothetical protein [Frankiaceae bacterium]